MSRRGLLALVLLLWPVPRPVQSALLRVPEEFSLDQAIVAAAAGDTLSVATGTYTKIPAAFSKPILIQGRGLTPDLTVLPGLRAGRARIENVTFELGPNPGGQTALLEPLDSLTVADCVFRSPATAIRRSDAEATSEALIRILRCRFSGLLLGLEWTAGDAAQKSRFELEDCAFENCANGILAVAAAPLCGAPQSSLSGGEPLPAVDSRLRLTRCTLTGTADRALDVTGTIGARLEACTLSGHALGLRLDRAEALVVDSEFVGALGADAGIRLDGGRLTLIRTTIRGHALGLDLLDASGCLGVGATIGGSIDTFCHIFGNALNLRTISPVQAEYNYWGALNCLDALALVQGQGLGLICDDIGRPLVNCTTPVEPTTWSRIKAAFGGRTDGPAGPAAPEGHH